MSNFLNDAFDEFVKAIEKGMFIVPPHPGGLGGYRPDFSALANHRDTYGILGQIQKGSLVVDFGDGAHKTGIAAFCNSGLDQSVLPHFEADGIMVRYPYAVPANNWRNCSRDQLLAYVAGCWRTGQHAIVERLLRKHMERLVLGIPTCQNTENDFEGTVKDPPVGDLLAPHDMMFLRVCMGEKNAYLDGPGQFSLLIAIQITSAAIDHEYTQLLLEAIVCGKLDFFVFLHPEYKANLRYYWGKRDQMPIAESLIFVCEQELERYKDQLTIPILIPIHLIKQLLTIDWAKELFNLNPFQKEIWAAKLATAMAADAYQYALAVYKLNMALLDLAGKAIYWVGEIIDVFTQLIKDGIGLAAEFLTNILELGRTNLTELFEQFTEQIVERLSVKMKVIIEEALYKNNYLLLKTRVSSFEEQYRDYLRTKDSGQLNYLNQTAYDIIALAEVMGIPAIGIYCLMRFLQIAVFTEKAKTDDDYLELVNLKISQMESHINKLLAEAYYKIEHAFTFTAHLLAKPNDPAEPQSNRYKIYFDGGKVDEVEFPVEKPKGGIFNKFYLDLKTKKKENFYKEVFEPAVDMLASLKLAHPN